MNTVNIQIALNRIEEARKYDTSHLNLSGLQLTEIPTDISDMNFLDSIDLSFNKFVECSDMISKLYSLLSLNISNNYLQDICFDFYKEYSINEIDISSNLFYRIPYNLLQFDENKICIYFDNNPFLDSIPIEISTEGNLSYIEFYLDSLKSQDKTKRLFETKLLIVGKGSVGKTTLVKTLNDPEYKVKIGEENTTEGININRLYETVYFPAHKPYYSFFNDRENLYEYDEGLGNEQDKESYIYMGDISSYGEGFSDYVDILKEPYLEGEIFVEKDIKINVWDFGGQEILYSTHQFFLTQRSLYIFVWEPRADNEEESFEYWLSIIQRLSKNCPVIIVMNKADIRIKSIDEKNYLDIFKNIVGFFNISCFTKEGIQELKRQIRETISKLPHLGDRLPQTWENIREELARKELDYITFDDFKEICGFNEIEKVNHLSGYLNDLGDIIYFKDDIMLNNLVIINPHWLTKAIYQLIHSLQVQKNNGLFEANNLSKYLNDKQYPKGKHYELLSLMEKFEICFKVIGSSSLYVIPTLLKAQSPSIEELDRFRISEALRYKVRYNFLPSGLIERLICRLNNHLEDSLFWKYGAIFNSETCRALVELNKIKKSINLYIIGEMKSHLYTIITHELNQIHIDLKLEKIDYKELYACSCVDCLESNHPYMFEKELLAKYIIKGRKLIDCRNSLEQVDIEELMIGYKSVKAKESLIRDFVSASSQLQTRLDLLKGFNENQINTYFQDLMRQYLSSKKLTLNEQSLKGRSESGKNQGELDIAVETIEGNTISFFEGFILAGLNTKIIETHLNKSMLNYDSNGLNEKYVGIYSRAKNFSSLSAKYKNYIDGIQIENVEIESSEDISNIYVNGSEIRVIRTKYRRNKIQLNLYHLLINIYTGDY
ncbi:hypothetical protein BZG01_08955 [Labilibaculum manganireducens]|uniref:non-specific serine/threonine protein kinase n=1 Tax=Labilibaculum manganireducens TaxID=1940525 RepID=A0A2N3I9B4_9BACT|nr:COR domain-containing protein [Labilibaculum manganireducens]PKQ66921.1 hypothetical protein BZG01_08955 [Labilibaculum manganireducens]